MFVTEAIILAGGLGTRLSSVVKDIPKVMAPINERPFLEYLFDYLETYKINRVVLSVGHKFEDIQSQFGNKYNSIHIDYAIEDSPLGTGGGIKKAFEKIQGNRAFVFNGDTMFRINLNDLIDFHSSNKSDFSIVLRELDNVQRYGSVEIDINQRITIFNEKGKKEGIGFINGGIYLTNKQFFNNLNLLEKFSLEKDCLEKLYTYLPFYGLICRQYFIDIGIPEDYLKAQNDFKKFNY